MKKFEKPTEAAQEVMDLLSTLPDEKLAMFFFNLFGFEALDEMAFELIQGQMESGRLKIGTEEEAAAFINTMII